MGESFKFGDIIENGWASTENPTRVGIFLRKCKKQGVNCLEMTDGKGKIWHVVDDRESKHKKLGTALDSDWAGQIAKAREASGMLAEVE